MVTRCNCLYLYYTLLGESEEVILAIIGSILYNVLSSCDGRSSYVLSRWLPVRTDTVWCPLKWCHSRFTVSDGVMYNFLG